MKCPVRFRRRILLSVLFAGFAFLPIASLSAHPHMFLDSHVRFDFSRNEFRGVTLTWIFDEMFSAGIIMDFDTDRSGQFEPEETAAIEMGAFSNLVNFGYFTFTTIDGTRRSVETVESFSARIAENGKLEYRFFVPVGLPITDSLQRFTVSVYDATYFVEITASEERPVVTGAETAEVTIRAYDDTMHAYWGGTLTPVAFEIGFRRKE